MSDPTDAEITALFQQLRMAQQVHEEARATASAARSREIDALNRLNALQREIDGALKGLRKSAPTDSDWALNSRRQQPAV